MFISQPLGFDHPQLPHYVCKLHKLLYDLKQAQRTWSTKLLQFLVSFEFSLSKMDISLFIYNSDGIKDYILVYIDDIILTRNSNKFITVVIDQLGHAFSIPIWVTLISSWEFNWSATTQESNSFHLNICVICWIKQEWVFAILFSHQWQPMPSYIKKIVQNSMILHYVDMLLDIFNILLW